MATITVAPMPTPLNRAQKVLLIRLPMPWAAMSSASRRPIMAVVTRPASICSTFSMTMGSTMRKMSRFTCFLSMSQFLLTTKRPRAAAGRPFHDLCWDYGSIAGQKLQEGPGPDKTRFAKIQNFSPGNPLFSPGFSPKSGPKIFSFCKSPVKPTAHKRRNSTSSSRPVERRLPVGRKPALW